jgi:hypothetical protein
MAMLHVVVNETAPQTILIDEPQSFLHPGAIRKLLGIFQRFPHHQYIVSTHAPVVISAGRPGRVILVQKDGGESRIEAIDGDGLSGARSILGSLGASLTDVFGCDSVLWVEGKTEQECFPEILSHYGAQLSAGCAIVGLVDTGRLQGKQADLTLEIYRKLTNGWALVPPALGFILDSELRSDTEKQDLVRASNDLMRFLPRRMYENHLLNPEAIAHVVAKGLEVADGAPETPVSVDRARDLLSADRGGREGKDWLESVDGAALLRRVFRALSDGSLEYDKVEHGLALTRCILAKCPDELRELGDLLVSVVKPSQSGGTPTSDAGN